MSVLISYLFSPWTIVTAVAGALIAGRWFSDSFSLSGEMICAFFAAWLLRPLILMLGAASLDEAPFQTLALMLNTFGGTLFGAAFAAAGATAFKLYDEGF
jgi:hypothetical protein